jgi:hypothetical protein
MSGSHGAPPPKISIRRDMSVSVIVPVYDAGAVLERSLDALVAQ